MARADGVLAALFNRARSRSQCLPVRVTQSRESDARTRTVATKMNQNIIIDTGRLIEEVRCRPLLIANFSTGSIGIRRGLDRFKLGSILQSNSSNDVVDRRKILKNLSPSSLKSENDVENALLRNLVAL
jgi:hypothetical protein